MGRPVRLRALPLKSAVGAVAVILLPPRLDAMPGVCQGSETILVQAFISQPSVETFLETVIRGFSGPAVFQADAMVLRPFIQGPACELRAIVRKEPG